MSYNPLDCRKYQAPISLTVMPKTNTITTATLDAFNFNGARRSEITIKIPAIRYSVRTLPTNGIKKKPAQNVPAMLPTVDKAYRRPTVAPDSASEDILSFTAYGVTKPNATLAGAKRRSDASTDLI